MNVPLASGRNDKIIGYSTKLRCSKLSCRFILGSRSTSISRCPSASQPCQPCWGWVGWFVLLQHVGDSAPCSPRSCVPFLWRNGTTCSSSMYVHFWKYVGYLKMTSVECHDFRMLVPIWDRIVSVGYLFSMCCHSRSEQFHYLTDEDRYHIHCGRWWKLVWTHC